MLKLASYSITNLFTNGMNIDNLAAVTFIFARFSPDTIFAVAPKPLCQAEETCRVGRSFYIEVVM